MKKRLTNIFKCRGFLKNGKGNGEGTPRIKGTFVDDKESFKEAKKFNEKVFASKEKMRRTWAKKPMAEKIKELVKLQEVTAALHPELRKIIPWRLKK